MYSEYGFILDGVEYATESEALEALAEARAQLHSAIQYSAPEAPCQVNNRREREPFQVQLVAAGNLTSCRFSAYGGFT